MKVTRKIIEIDEDLCNGCGDCVPSCHEGAIQIIDGKARLVADKYCDGLGACLGDCPTGALKIVERTAEDFDEQAVEERLKKTEAPPVAAHGGCPSAAVKSFAGQGGGCPSSRMATFEAPPGAAVAVGGPAMSELTHWPIQIGLIPPHAPFLEKADLLVTADCVPFAFPSFHQDFLKDKVVMVGCPKFDDTEMYEQRFTDIFEANDINSVTAMVMEVPCCQGLPVIVQNAMRRAGKEVPLETVTVSLQGEIIGRRQF